MAARIIDDKATWDAFVEESPYGLLFHKWDFLKIMEKYSGTELLSYGIYKGDELICLFPFFYKKNGVKLLYSPPMLVLTYVSYLGFIMSKVYDNFRQSKKEMYLEIVARDINEEIARLSPNFVSISIPPGLLDVRPFTWSGFSLKQQYNYVTDLQKPVEELWESFDKNLRKDVRSLEKRANLLKITKVKDAELLFTVMRKTLAHQGQTFYHIQTPDYLKDLMAAFPDNIEMNQLHYNGDLASINVVVKYKKQVVGWMGGTSLMDDAPFTEYLIWEIMKTEKSNGFKTFANWGGDVKRLNTFKTKFNPALEYCQLLQKNDMFGEMAGRAFYTALNIPVVKDVILKTFSGSRYS